MPKRKWPEPIKSEALKIAAAKGSRAASEATGVPQATVRVWVHPAALSSVAVSGGTVVVPERDRFGRPLTWRERQPVIVEQMGDLIELGLAQTRIAFEAGRLRDAQAGTIAAAVLIDKCQLLTGSATDRRESFTAHAGADEVARRIRELEAELGVTPRGEIE